MIIGITVDLHKVDMKLMIPAETSVQCVQGMVERIFSVRNVLRRVEPYPKEASEEGTEEGKDAKQDVDQG